MRWLLAFPFRLFASALILISKGSSRLADGSISIASYIDPQEPTP